MRKNAALLIAIAITTFVIMIIVGLTTRLPLATASVATSVPAATPTAVTLDPTTEALIRGREEQYRQALADAQAQLAAANAKLAAASQQPAPTDTPISTSDASAVGQAYAISAEQALAIAQQAVPDGHASKVPELVSIQGVPNYEVVFDLGTVYVDAQTGVVQFDGASAGTGGPVTAEQAAQAAISYLGGGTVTEVKQDKKRGIDVFRVRFRDGTDIYVGAASGQVVYAEVHTVGQEHEENEHQAEQHGDDD